MLRTSLNFVRAIALGGLVLLAACSPTPDDTALPLTQRFETTTRIQFSYPAEWRATIPDQNIIFLGDEAVLQQAVGASMTIQRNVRLTGEAETLADAMTLFLERGPLVNGTAWAVLESAQPTTIDGRAALVTVLEGAATPADPPLHAEITIARADNGMLYVFALSAPVADWPTIAPTFAAILASVTLAE